MKLSGAAPGHFVAQHPLDIVQIDHTLADIILVDEAYCHTIGWPWLTLAIDVATRSVVALYVGFDRPNAMAGGDSSALLHDSEHLTRLLLRRAWAKVPRRQQRLLRLAVRCFDPNKPAIKVAATQVNAAAWLLAAMHWNGCRHPSALWCKPLHPLTGVVRWLSGFDVVEQHEHSREILTNEAGGKGRAGRTT